MNNPTRRLREALPVGFGLAVLPNTLRAFEVDGPIVQVVGYLLSGTFTVLLAAFGISWLIDRYECKAEPKTESSNDVVRRR